MAHTLESALRSILRASEEYTDAFDGLQDPVYVFCCMPAQDETFRCGVVKEGGRLRYRLGGSYYSFIPPSGTVRNVARELRRFNVTPAMVLGNYAENMREVLGRYLARGEARRLERLLS